jgi:hypothetical protein
MSVFRNVEQLTDRLHSTRSSLAVHSYIDGQEIPSFFMELEGWSPCSKSHVTVPYLIQFHPVHIFMSNLSNIHLSTVLVSSPRSPKWCFPQCIWTEIWYAFFIFCTRTTDPSNCIHLYLVTQQITAEENKLRSASFCIFPANLCYFFCFRS